MRVPAAGAFRASPAPLRHWASGRVQAGMITVRIPWVGHEVAANSDKVHTIFRVEVLTNGRKHSVDRRFRDFQALHKKLKKTMKPPDFPLKRGLNRWPKALDQRRTGLEAYLQTLLCSTHLVSQEILDFLNIKHVPSKKPTTTLRELCEVDLQNYRRFCHQVVAFTKDSFAGYQSAEDLLPNVIVAGVLQGLYLTDPLSEIKQESSGARRDRHQLTGLGNIV